MKKRSLKKRWKSPTILDAQGQRSIFISQSLSFARGQSYKTAWQTSTDYCGKVLAPFPCYYCQSGATVKNYYEQWRYMHTEVFSKDDKEVDFDRLRYYSALPVCLLNFQDSVRSRAIWIHVMWRLVMRQTIYKLSRKPKQKKGKGNNQKKKKVKINKWKQVREAECEGERKRWGEQRGSHLPSSHGFTLV